MRIIPAIDIINGKCVRLTKGDYATQKTYSENPLEVAKAFEASGITNLHLVDLDGAKAQHIVNYKVLERIATNTSLQIDFGGGLKADEDLKIAFNSGAKQITGGSIAVKQPEVFLNWVNVYGADKIILGADVSQGKIAISGWLEKSDHDILPFIKGYLNNGLEYVICTDISKDGMLEGPSLDLYTSLINQLSENLKLIASGGVSSLQDLDKLKAIGCDAAIIGKAFYEKKMTLKELEKFILNTN